MSKAYSIDLRERVLEHLEKGTRKEASALFQVGIATVYRWIKQKKEKGHVRPKKKKYAYKKLDDRNLKMSIEENPDRFEITEHFSVTPQAIF